MKQNEKINNWIVAVSGSDIDEVHLQSFTGTLTQVKNYVIGLIKKDSEKYGGYLQINDIKFCKHTNSFLTYRNYPTQHIRYEVMNSNILLN